ncbi:PIG-L deacetylase family protein [Comamonas antarctica]|uniref:PIG-L family deacetylase n=1 Tax=Comamonas antarctica TaxID=2743470 RepID=A0A6N1X731_9BURK|nr:PIG-L family deacetylase [Comamonas antarctica]QKV55229.1 PIG-L family deacetylase [Comamonas antarctica]
MQAKPLPDDLLRGFRSLCVLAPHPDDEIFGCFGLIRCAQRLGLRIEVHVVTDGELCFGSLPASEEQALRAARQQESCAAAALLGYPPPTFWGLGDSQLLEQAALVERGLQNHCRADALCVAPWCDDGHPDHEVVARALRQVAAPGQCLHYPVWGLVDKARREQFFALDAVHGMALAPPERALKQQAAALFATQFSRHEAADAIVRAEFLAAFTTEHEYYLHAH